MKLPIEKQRTQSPEIESLDIGVAVLYGDWDFLDNLKRFLIK